MTTRYQSILTKKRKERKECSYPAAVFSIAWYVLSTPTHP